MTLSKSKPPSEVRPVLEPADAATILIEHPEDLQHCCRRWQQLPAIALDTEFVRERTFFPILGLIQVHDGTDSYLIDPTMPGELEPLGEILLDSSIDKVLHSCGEDLEVLFHRFGALPTAVFDTQIAAAFAGHGRSLGYARLVLELFGVDLPKGETRTNWLQRPLTAAQKRYAALDVAYLLPAYTILRQRLQEQGREDWAREELQEIAQIERFLPPLETAYLRIKHCRGLSRRQLAVLRRLAEWREREARQRNLPRNFVLHETCLPQLAKQQPRNLDRLKDLGILEPHEIRRYGRPLLELIAQARETPDDELPPALDKALDLSPYRQELKSLRNQVAVAAADLGLPADLVASRKVLERLLRRAILAKEPILPRALRGWRRAVIGDTLLESLRRRFAR